MIDPRYLKYMFFALLGSTGVVVMIVLSGRPLDLPVAALAYVLGVAITSLVTVRLPVFRTYYGASTATEFKKYRGYSNGQAAMAMTGLFAGVIIGVGLYLLGVHDVLTAGFVAGIAAAFVSQYHEKRELIDF